MDHRRATRPARRPPRRGGPRALAAAILASSAGPAAGSFLGGRYDPSPANLADVDALAALDLDRRSIEARLAAGTAGGMAEARDVYEKGRYDNGVEDKVTLQRLSTEVDKAMGIGSETYMAFKGYYGDADYADQWIRAAFDGSETRSTKGDYDFVEFGLEGRGTAIIYGTLALNVWMSVVGRLEEAANLCMDGAGEDKDLVAEWDRAVALYTGSIARDEGEDGYMLYTLAEVECAEFGTCALGEMAPVNDKIFDAFNFGKAYLKQGKCPNVLEKANAIKSLMTVPLIQGTLRAMHALDVYGHIQGENDQGRGAAFAAGLLPLVHACGAGDDQVLHNDLRPGKILEGSYDVVKAALERSYECLGVTCADVGGIVNARGDAYAEGAQACGNVRPVDNSVEDDDPSDETSGTSGTSGDGLDDFFEYDNDYAYFEGKDPFKNYDPNERVGSGDGHTGADMDPVRAALISGLSFGIFGFVGGAAIKCACKARRKKKKEHSEVEFVDNETREETGMRDSLPYGKYFGMLAAGIPEDKVWQDMFDGAFDHDALAEDYDTLRDAGISLTDLRGDAPWRAQLDAIASQSRKRGNAPGDGQVTANAGGNDDALKPSVGGMHQDNQAREETHRAEYC